VTGVLPADAFAELTRTAAADGIQQLVVGAVIRHGSDVLLLKRPADDFMGGIWELPSGKVEPDETLGQAVAREVLEEAGLTVTGRSLRLDVTEERWRPVPVRGSGSSAGWGSGPRCWGHPANRQRPAW
jgi:8-oxo-dGTP pyrophosphatase MutT (NUDIX family)